MKTKKKNSFTLVEVLIATTIFVILITLGMTSLSSFIHWKKRETANNALQEAGRHALEVISNEVEKANITKSVSEGSDTYFGFYFNDSQLKVYSEPSTVIFEKNGNALNKNGQNLIPATVTLESLNFSGYPKKVLNLTAADYQQPYLTVKMTLSASSVDPSTGTSRLEKANFQTTVRPQPLELMGYAEVQSGSEIIAAGPNPSSQDKFFDNPFSGAPNVVISRTASTDNDQYTHVSSTSPDKFRFDVETPGKMYWFAVNGNFPNLIKTGRAYTSSFTIPGTPIVNVHCPNGEQALCINYDDPFPPADPPVVVISKSMRTESDIMMNYIYGSTNRQFKIGGRNWDGSEHAGYFNWISFSPKLETILSPEGIKFNAKQTTTKVSYNNPSSGDGNFYCPYVCTYTNLTTSVDQYACGFREDSNPLAKTTFTSPFSQPPNVVVSVAGTSRLDPLFDNPWKKQTFSTPGFSVDVDKFTYTNPYPGSTAMYCPLPGTTLFRASEINFVASRYKLNSVAIGSDVKGFKIRWSYK